MWVWVYKGVLDFSLRLKIKRCIGIFLDTYSVFFGNFSGFSERVFECCYLVAKKVREKEMREIFFVFGFRGKARKDKKMNGF